MIHYNFFDLCKKDRKEISLLSISNIIKFGIFIVFALTFIIVYQLFQLIQLSLRLDYLKEIKSDEVFNNQYNVSLEIANKIESVEKQEAFIDKTQNAMNVMNTVNTNLFRSIYDSLPPSVDISSIKVNDCNIEIEGTSGSIDELIEWEIQMKELGYFSLVHIDSIEKSEIVANNLEVPQVFNAKAKYDFVFQLILKEGAIIDEGK